MRPSDALPIRWIVIGAGLVLVATIAAGLWWRVEVRHSAPFGFSLTFDRPRAIAVRGGYVSANYDDFHRIDLDLRAYSAGERYDLTLHVSPAGEGAADVRTVHLALDADDIWHDKSTFGNPFLRVTFPPIPDSAGRRYYVWVESGPRNRDSIWTLWSIKSYSRVPAAEVVGALIDRPPEPLGNRAGGVVLILLVVGTILSAGWLLGVMVVQALPRIDPEPAGRENDSVAASGG